MKRFAVFRGFGGSGKTMTMMALVRNLAVRGTEAAMISNDLGRGFLPADHRLAQLHGCCERGFRRVPAGAPDPQAGMPRYR